MIINWEQWAQECMREHLSGALGRTGRKGAGFSFRHCSFTLGAACRAAVTKTKGFGDTRIIIVLQTIALPINQRAPFAFPSTGLGGNSAAAPGHDVFMAAKSGNYFTFTSNFCNLKLLIKTQDFFKQQKKSNIAQSRLCWSAFPDESIERFRLDVL